MFSKKSIGKEVPIMIMIKEEKEIVIRNFFMPYQVLRVMKKKVAVKTKVAKN